MEKDRFRDDWNGDWDDELDSGPVGYKRVTWLETGLVEWVPLEDKDIRWIDGRETLTLVKEVKKDI